MKKNPWLCLVLIVLINGCKKNDTPVNPPNNPPPAVTPVGTPVGNLVTKNIGASGGSLISPDRRLELDIPAAALGNNTDISIQPVTNESPGGIGLAYHLMPDGTTFSKPVTITYHYTDDDIKGTLPYLLYIAYQDNLLTWKADLKKRNVDTVTKTVSLGISHFSIWTLGEGLIILSTPTELHENDTSGISIRHVDVPSDPGAGPDDLPSLPVTSLLPDQTVSNWKVNGHSGNSEDGTIAGSGSKATYTAPSTIDEERTVQVSAELNYELVFFNNGREIAHVNKLILFTDLKLLENKFSYDVKIDYEQNATSGSITDAYTDGATLQVDVVNDEVNISNIINKKPNALPASGTAADGETLVEWQADSLGTVNITNVSGTILYGTPNLVNITFTHQGTAVPKWKFTPSNGSPYFIGGEASPGYPGNIVFILNDSTQSVKNLNYITATITPRF